MDFMGIGILELFIVLLLMLMVFGPEKMIQTARIAGRYVQKFRMITAELNRQINEELDREAPEIRDDLRELRNDLSSEISGITGSLTDTLKPAPENHSNPDRQVKKEEQKGSQAGETDG